MALTLSSFVWGKTDIMTFVRANHATLENIKAVHEKATLYDQAIAPALEQTTNPVDQVIWNILAGFATSDYRQNCAQSVMSFQTARSLVKNMNMDQRQQVIAILENPDFIDFKVATRLPMGYNAYAVARLNQGGQTASTITAQLKGWSDYYSAILELLYDLSQPLDKCGVCEDCVNCPLYKFKVTFFNYKAILNQDEFYKKLDFIKLAATRAQDLGRAIESRYDLQ